MTEQVEKWDTVKKAFVTTWPVLSQLAGKIIEFIRTSQVYTKVQYLNNIYCLIKSGASFSRVKNELSSAPENCETIAKELIEFFRSNGKQGNELICKKLESMMYAQYNAISIVMFMNAVNALTQSVAAWYTIWNYKIKQFERKMARIKEYMDEAVKLLLAIIDEVTRKECQEQITRTLQHLEDAKVLIQDICDDIEDEMRDVKTMKSNSLQQSAINFVSLATNIVSIAIVPSYAVSCLAAILVGSSITIHSACTIGNLIAAGHAQDLLDQLKNQLAIMQKTEDERQQLENRLKRMLENPQ